MKKTTLFFILILPLAVICQKIPDSFPEEKLVGYWSFNGTPNDLSKSHNNAIVHNAKLSSDKSSYLFNGQNDNIVINDSEHLNFDTEDNFSVNLIVKSNLQASPGMIFSKMVHSSPYRGFEIFTNTKGTILVYMIHDADKNNFILLETNESVLADKLIHHIMVTYDGSSSADGINIYIDNKLKAHTASTNNLNASMKTSANINIGSRNEQCCFESGIIDELAVWNKVLDKGEIDHIYNHYKINYPEMNKVGESIVEDVQTLQSNKINESHEQIMATAEYTPTSSYNFDTLAYGSVNSFKVEVSNTGNSNLVLYTITSSCGCVQAEILNHFIKPKQSGFVNVLFKPTSSHKGHIRESFTIKSNAANAKEHTIEINAYVDENSKKVIPPSIKNLKVSFIPKPLKCEDVKGTEVERWQCCKLNEPYNGIIFTCDDNGRVYKRVSYHNGIYHGKVEKWEFGSNEGYLYHVSIYNEGEKQKERSYNTAGKLTFKRDWFWKKEGSYFKQKIWYLNMAEELSKKKLGDKWVFNGQYITYYSDYKTIKVKGTYLNGKEKGTWFYYHHDGSLKEKKYFK